MWRPILPSGHLHVAGLVEAQRRRALGVGEVGAGQVGRAAQQLGQAAVKASSAICEALREATVSALVCARRRRRPPPARSSSAARPSCGARIRRPVPGARRGRRRSARPTRLGGRPWPSRPRRRTFPWALERLVRPAQRVARELDLGAQRLAVRLGGVGAVRRALADVVLATISVGLSALRRASAMARSTGFDVVAVDRADHVPAVGRKRRGVSSMNQGVTWPSMEMPLSS
jgi:hypothetical protein